MFLAKHSPLIGYHGNNEWPTSKLLILKDDLYNFPPPPQSKHPHKKRSNRKVYSLSWNSSYVQNSTLAWVATYRPISNIVTL